MIDQETLNTFRDKVKAAAKSMGLDADKVNMTYSEHGFSFRGEVFEGDEGRREAFVRVARNKGFPSFWWKQDFVVKGETYTVTGAASRGRKYPVLATASSGKSYKFTIDTVRKAMEKKFENT